MKKELVNLEEAINLFKDSCKMNSFYGEKLDHKLANKSYFGIKKAVDYLKNNNLIDNLKI